MKGMNSNDVILSIVFFSQTGVGVIGNSFLIVLFISMFLSGHRLRPIDVILAQLALANCLVLLLKGIPQTITGLGLNNFLDITGCKIVLYLHRVARSLSLTMTCLLSGFQAINISPSNSTSADLKAKVPKYIDLVILLSWAFHVLQNLLIPIGIIDRNRKNTTEMQQYGYCSYSVPSGVHAFLLAFIFSFPDAIYMGLMVFSSSYMIFLLYRHHKQVEQIHMTCLSPRIFPEMRATKTIILLASIFVSSYSLNSILIACMSSAKTPPALIHTSAFLASCFPMVSPYLFISSDSQVPKYCYALFGRKTSHLDSINR